MINAKHNGESKRGIDGRTVCWIVISSACYYLATHVAWALCFPDSKVSLFFPPHAVLVAVLLITPTRHWWAYTLAAVTSHFIATQQAHWPALYALHCEVFDAVQNLATAAGIRMFIKSPFRLITLREAILFVLIAVVIVPFGTAFWGAAFTVSNHFGTHYWIEWRNLGVSNAVTSIVLVPVILLGFHHLSARQISATPARLLEAGLLGAGILMAGFFAFDGLSAGPDTSPILLYAPIPLLVWAALRFGLGGMSAAMLMITSQAIWGTMQGRGPFLAQTPAENALALQMFLLAMAIPLMFLTVVVAEEKRAKEALRKSEERYREVVESQTDLVCRHRADSTLTFVNDAYCRLFQRRREELLGRKLLDFIPPHAREALAYHIATLNAEQGAVTKEIEVALPDESTAWYQWTTNPVRANDGNAIEFQSIGHDISDRKRADEARRHLAHATRVSTLGALAGSLAHELNQPLTAILSNAQAGSRFLVAPISQISEVGEVLQDIAEDTKRAGEIIYRMRALVKNEAPDLQPVDLDGVIRDVVRLVRSDAVIRNVHVALELAPRLRPVRGDKVQLQQVMLNLLLNAFDATEGNQDDDRTVTVRLITPKEGTLQVAVCDRGHGLKKEQLDRLFRPFHTTKQHGLGLGLSISRSIIEAHRGRLWAENNADRGATFYFTLPEETRARDEERGARGQVTSDQ